MTLRYKTFESLLASVKSDLHNYADNNLLNDRNYLKTVRFVNSDLGLAINEIKDAVIDIKNYRAELPKNFLKGITAYMIFSEKVGNLSGGTYGTSLRQFTREELLEKRVPLTTDGCLHDCGDCTYIIREYSQKDLIYDKIVPVYLTNNSINRFCGDSPALRFNPSNREYQVDLREEMIYTNVEEGTLYLSFLSDLVDEEGNVLILDHPLIEPYYQWAIKSAMLEGIWYNSEADVERKLADARTNRDIARAQAVSLIVSPEYREMKNYNSDKIKNFYNQNVKFYV